jgi:hypothetical protein
MATYVNDLRLKEIATGDEAGTWGTSTNTNLELIANAMGVGAEAIANASTHTITMADGTADEFRSTFLRLTGGGQACTVTLAPNTLSHTWIMRNETAAALTLTQGSGANVTIAAGQTKIVATDGAGSGAIVYEMDDLELAGNLAVGGTLAVTGAFTNGSTLVSTGKITADAGIDIDNINIDGTTIALTSGDLTLDVAGDIVLDADGAQLRFKDAGTEIFVVSNEASGVQLYSTVSDSDIFLVGNDGGSAITALTLDMSEAGDATFNNFVTANRFYVPDSGLFIAGGGGDLKLSSDGTNGLIETVNGNLTLDVAGDITLDADGDEIFFKRGGVNGGRILMASAVFSIGSTENNGDVKIIGIDGGADLTACTFDMSAAGAATFNSTVTTPLLSITDGTTNGFLTSASGLLQFGASTTHPLVIYTNNAEKLRIDTSGRILVNTTSILSGSSAKLQVLQDVTGNWSQRINNSAADPYGLAISYVSASPNSTVSQFHYCVDSTGARWGVYSNGGVLNYSSNNVNLSDRNAKKDITLHTDDEWNCVKAWEIVDYRYKDEADDSPARIGVIAQQIQEHCPDLINVFQEQADAVEEVIGEDGEVVTEAKAAVEERIGVNEPQMMWKVTKALQEAMERIETLEAKVQTLENN